MKWKHDVVPYHDRPAVAGAIVGTRLGLTDHSEDNRRVFALKLDKEDLSRRVPV